MNPNTLDPEISESLALLRVANARHFQIVGSIQSTCPHLVITTVAPIVEHDGTESGLLTKCMRCTLFFRLPVQPKQEILS